MARRATARVLVPVAVAVAVSVACATTRPVRYTPSLSSVTIPLGDGAAPLTALASIVGPVMGRQGKPTGIEVRMRFENRGEVPVALEPDGIELVTADLQSLGPPELLPAGAVEIAPGGKATVGAVFPFAAEAEPSADALRALNLRFELEVGGSRYASSVTFDRVERERNPYPYPPYAYAYWGYPGFAPAPVVVVHRHHRGI